MADKEKRIQTFLTKNSLKGKLKSVKTFEEASIIVVEDRHSKTNNMFYDKRGFEYALENGETFPEDRVHFLVSTNPRNRKLVERSVLTNNHGLTDRTQ